jgi:spermidine synthase
LRTTGRHLLLLACFFLSGLAALVYQTAWTREFSFVFGTSDLAVATVLAAYMGGLAAGAAVASRFVGRVRRPLLMYGVLELGIALAALAVPLAIEASQGLYVLAFGVGGSPPSEGGLPSALFFLACSFAILLVPTGLMGATLPLLARHAVRSEAEIGSKIGALYAMNTFGAVVGTVLAAFFLLPAVGLRSTVLVAVSLNAVVFAAAALLARVAPLPIESSPATQRMRGDRRILPLIALSGMASFTYEVLWTRLLSHVLGGSVYAFGTMLAAFLVGIALGSALSMRWTRTRESAARGFAAAQLGTAVLSLVAYMMVDRLPELAAVLDEGGGARLFVDATMAMLTLLPAALCIGATFPFAVRLAAASAEDAASASARVYAWNTVGAIIGAVGAGFFVLPALGFEGTLALVLAVNLGLALASAGLAPPHARRVAMAAAVGLLVLAVMRPTPPWNLLRSDPSSRKPAPGRVVFYEVGRSATVLLLENVFGEVILRTNGLQDANIPPPGAMLSGYTVAYWLSLLPVLARPELESMLVVGLGGGLVLESVPPTVRTVDVIELEPQVIAANRAIADRRARNPLADPRVRLHVNDARGAMLLMEGGLDAIVSQPSHPWTAGASHLYTREFFELARSRLNPDGVFVQWMGLSFVDEALLRSLVATLLDVFPHVQVYQPNATSGVLFIASGAPIDIGHDGMRAFASAPDFYEGYGLGTREDLLTAQVLDDAGARKLAAGAPVITDDWNLLQMRSPGLRGHGLDTVSARKLFATVDDRAAPPPEIDAIRFVRTLLGVADEDRAARVTAAIEEPVGHAGAQGLIDLSKGDVAGATREFEAALRLDPERAEVRAALLHVRAGQLAGRATAQSLGLPEPTPAEAAVIEGWRRQRRGDRSGLRALDPALASIGPNDALFANATRLRASWRVASGDAALALEARELLDVGLARTMSPDDLVLRARAALTAGDDRTTLSTLAELRERLLSVPGAHPRWLDRRAQLARDALRVLDDVPPGDEQPARGSVLREQFRLLARAGRVG